MFNEVPMKRKLRIAFIIDHGESEETITQWEMDYLNPKHRQQMAKSATWALTNGHTVTTYPLRDDEEIEIITKDSSEVSQTASRR